MLAAVVLLLACGAAVHFVHGYQMDRNADWLLTRAERAEEDGDPEAAHRFLSQYVRFRPEAVDARAQLAELTESTATTLDALRDAYLTFGEVLRRSTGPERNDTLKRMAEIAARLGRPRDSLRHIAASRKEFPDGDKDGDLSFLAGQCHEALGQIADATKQYARSISLAPAEVERYAALAFLIRSRPEEIPRRSDLKELGLVEELEQVFPASAESSGNEATLERVLELAIVNGQPRHEAFLVRSQLRREREEFAGAAADVASALEFADNNPDVLFAAGTLALEQAEDAREKSNRDGARHFLGQARSYADRGLKAHPYWTRFYLLKSMIELFDAPVELSTPEAQMKHLARAKQPLLDALDALPVARSKLTGEELAEALAAEPEVIRSLADLLLSECEVLPQSSSSQFTELLAELRGTTEDPALADYLEARELVIQREWHRAALALEKTRPRIQDFEETRRHVDLYLARCYRSLENPDALLRSLRRALQSDPGWSRGRIELADALASNNQLDEAVRQYQIVATPTPTPSGEVIPSRYAPQANLGIARLLFLKELRRPESDRDWSDLDKWLDSAADLPAAQVLRARVLAVRGDYNAAQRILEQARLARPDDSIILAAIAELELVRKDADAEVRIENARKALDAARREVGDSVQLRMVAALAATLLPPEDARKSVRELEGGSDRLSRTERVALLSGLARIYQAIGARDDAARLLRQAASLDPTNLAVQLELATHAATSHDEPALRNVLKSIRDIEGPGGPSGNYVEAGLILAEIERMESGENGHTHVQRLEDAHELLRQAARRRPRWPDVRRTLGMLEQRRKNAERAFEHFSAAMELGARDPETVSRVLQYLGEHERNAEAAEVIARLEQEDSALLAEGPVADLAWMTALRQQQYDEAIDRVEALASRSPKFQHKVVNAQLLLIKYQSLSADQQQQPAGKAMIEKAKSLCRAAVDQAPGEPDAWLTYVILVVGAGQLELAEAVIEEAAGKLAPEPKVVKPLTLARCCTIARLMPQAEQHFLQAIEADPKDVQVRLAAAQFFLLSRQPGRAEQQVDNLLERDGELPDSVLDTARLLKARAIGARGSYSETGQALVLLKRSTGDGAAASIENLRTQAALLSRRPTHRDRMALISVLEELKARDALEKQERLQLAAVYDRINQWPKARALAEELLREAPHDGGVLSWLALATLRHSSQDPKLSEAAAEYVARLRETEPDSLRTAEAQARLLAARGHADRGAELIRDFIIARELPAVGERQDATAREVQLARSASRICEELEQPRVAEELLRRSIELSGDPDGLLLLAGFFRRKGDMEKALFTCEQAQAICTPEVIAMGAAELIFGGRPEAKYLERAEAIIQKALTARPDSLQVLTALAGLRTVQNRNSEAELLYRQILQRDPRDAAALNNLALLLAAENRNLEEAESLINRAIAHLGPIPDLLDSRAMVYLSRRRTKDAIADLEEAIVTAPSPVLYFHLARAYLQQGDLPAARDAFRSARDEGLTTDDLHSLEHSEYERLRQRLSDAVS